MWRGTRDPQNLTQDPKVSGKKIVYSVQALFYASHPKGGEWNNVTDHKLSKLISPRTCGKIIVADLCVHVSICLSFL